MKKLLFLGALFLAVRGWAVAPVVSPSTPIVNQGSSIQFSADASGSWACSATNSTGGVTACSGSINSGSGLYTAPAAITAQHTYGGMQLLPNNHVYNVRIDSLPVHALNPTWFSAAQIGGSPHWNTDFPINYVTPASPTDTMSFIYTAGNNGSFEIPAFPSAKAEAGWFSALQNRPPDHHVIMVDTMTATFSETYQYFPNCLVTAASVSANVATLTCSKNPINNEFLVGSTVAVGGFTGADTYFSTPSVILTAVTATSLKYALVHANAVATTTGSVTKDLNCYPATTCNSVSGIKYTNNTYLLPQTATDAAGMQLQPLILGLQELEQAVVSSGSINHAFRNTFGIGVEASSFTWPATTFASDGGTIPFGTRLRLKGSFDISSYSTIAKVLLRALQRYGTFNVDGGNEWPMNAEVTRWPKAYYDALDEIIAAGRTFTITNTVLGVNVATITANNDFDNRSQVTITGTSNGSGVFNVQNIRVSSATPTQFSFALVHAPVGTASDSGSAFSALANYMEFVDESSIMVSTDSGKTKYNRELITFTRTSDSVTSSVDVVLNGPAVNLPNDVLYIMAGTPAQQLAAMNNYGGVTWTMTPTVGSLTSGGFYTPPTTVTAATTTIITATSVIASSVAAQMSVTIFPSSGIYVIPSKTVNYTDVAGHVWNARTGFNSPDTLGCCACDNSPSFPAVTDVALWNCQIANTYSGGDTHMDFLVPNGNYQVVYHYGTQFATGGQFFKLSVGSTEVYSNLDPTTVAGGQYKTFTSTSTTVSNNLLSVGIWNMNDAGAPVSSLSIVPNVGTTVIPVRGLSGRGTFSGRGSAR